MENLLLIAITANVLIFFITLLGLLADYDLNKNVLSTCIISGVTTILLVIFVMTTPLAKHVLNGSAVIEYKMINGNVVDSCYVFKK
jgi:hypothetical protein